MTTSTTNKSGSAGENSSRGSIVTNPHGGDRNMTIIADPDPKQASAKKRYTPSLQGRMLQEHREAAGISREELSIRKAATRTNRESWKLCFPGNPEFCSLESEAAREVPWIQRAERSYQPMRDWQYDELHALIDLLPAGTGPVETQAAVLARAEELHEQARNELIAELRDRGIGLARLIWESEYEGLDQLISLEMRQVGEDFADRKSIVSEVGQLRFVMRVALLDLADELRVMYPERPSFGTEVTA